MKNNLILKNRDGITLIALVITIIVLLVLAGVSLTLVTGDNGIIKKSQSAKIETEIAEEKEIISNAVAQIKAIKPFETMEDDEFRNALDYNSPQNNKATLADSDDEKFLVYFAKNERVYDVYKDGNIDYKGQSAGLKKITVSCVNKDINGNIVTEFPEKTTVYKTLTKKYTIVPPQIEGYVPASEEIIGETTEDTQITVEYYKILTNNDLVFTAYTENGVEKYQIGTGTGTAGNGLNEKNVKSVLYVPELNEGKLVDKIGRNSFQGARNIINIKINENIKSVNHEAFKECSNIKEIDLNCENIYSQCVFGFNRTRVEKVILGKNVERLDATTFNGTTLTYLVINSNDVELNNAIGGTIDNVEVNSDNTKYEVVDNVLYSKDISNRKIYMYPTGRQGDFVIPSDVKELGRCSFSSAKLTSIEIPDNVKDIRHEAFKYASLQEATVNCENIWDECVFGFCGIKTVRIGNNVKKIGGTTFNGDSNVEIIYEGTREEWNALVGNKTFNAVTKITCSDDL